MTRRSNSTTTRMALAPGAATAALETTIHTRKGEPIALSSLMMSKTRKKSTMISIDDVALTKERCQAVAGSKTSKSRHSISGNRSNRLTNSGAMLRQKSDRTVTHQNRNMTTRSKYSTSSMSSLISKGRLPKKE